MYFGLLKLIAWMKSGDISTRGRCFDVSLKMWNRMEFVLSQAAIPAILY